MRGLSRTEDNTPVLVKHALAGPQRGRLTLKSSNISKAVEKATLKPKLLILQVGDQCLDLRIGF
jgi:hypothetical protein